MIINTANLYTIERHLRDSVSKEGYTKVFAYLDEHINMYPFEVYTLSLEHHKNMTSGVITNRTVLFEKNHVVLMEHGFKGYEYHIQRIHLDELPILKKWIESKQ